MAEKQFKGDIKKDGSEKDLENEKSKRTKITIEMKLKLIENHNKRLRCG